MEFKKEFTGYSIEMSDKDFDILEHQSFENWYHSLCGRLDKIKGVDGADHNGHFGNFVFITIEVEFDTKETKEAIAGLIKEHVAMGRIGYD